MEDMKLLSHSTFSSTDIADAKSPLLEKPGKIFLIF